MTEENDKKVALPSAKNSSWYKLMQKSIKLDGKKYPRGYHWLIALYQLSIVTDITKTQENLPEKHRLKLQLFPSEIIEANLKSIEKELETLLSTVKKDRRIDFSGLHFEESIDFSNFIFPIYVSFERSKFSGNVSFENAVFNDYSNFKESEFKRRIVFQRTVFENHAPRFYGAIFSNELILNRVELPESKKFKHDAEYETYQKTIEENKSAYETLIYLMEKQNKHHDKHRFFREEMRWRQLGSKLTQKRLKDDSHKAINAKHPISQCIGIFLTCISFCFFNKIAGCFSHKEQDVDYFIWKRIENRLTIILFGLYDYLSDYGYGIGRTLFWWALHIILGIIAIAFIAYYQGLEIGQVAFCSISTAFANANPFVFFGFKEGALMDCYECLHDLSPLLFGTIRGVQTVIGIPILFLLLTTLRVRFRIK